ncbi:uncharacterized protein ASPGLDRAFT_757938 [Aspergillus glaucus CBS 516.65]|uniref:Uncharacterized protein n=1 Tax=Aspergillus glaucus CBS 516.65 TaxID=1160497 RepID=A0A1L9VYE0_ASPGL|nr:hypothetical protein ASPGLDRAFT_757938 [Aspergillus glaucus CBS 516.65]OJJ88915.1 hypothetical protein ASPGLDRAFT_757938 [Aspergillus glaucus CBS 516.65]
MLCAHCQLDIIKLFVIYTEWTLFVLVLMMKLSTVLRSGEISFVHNREEIKEQNRICSELFPRTESYLLGSTLHQRSSMGSGTNHHKRLP